MNNYELTMRRDLTIFVIKKKNVDVKKNILKQLLCTYAHNMFVRVCVF